jgi:hypothetical protein
VRALQVTEIVGAGWGGYEAMRLIEGRLATGKVVLDVPGD